MTLEVIPNRKNLLFPLFSRTGWRPALAQDKAGVAAEEVTAVLKQTPTARITSALTRSGDAGLRPCASEQAATHRMEARLGASQGGRNGDRSHRGAQPDPDRPHRLRAPALRRRGPTAMFIGARQVSIGWRPALASAKAGVTAAKGHRRAQPNAGRPHRLRAGALRRRGPTAMVKCALQLSCRGGPPWRVPRRAFRRDSPPT